MLAAGLVRYKSDEENNEEIINHFAVQSFEADCRDNGSQYNILAIIKNTGKKGGHRENKRDFLELQYNNRKRVLKKKPRRKKTYPEIKRRAGVNMCNSQR